MLHRGGTMILLGLLLTMLMAVMGQESDVALACNATECLLPDCRCANTQTPGDIPFEQVPQFVLLSFDDGVTVTNFPFYEKLSQNMNPNQCNISMTFFVSHENTDYTLVNELHRWGHEIATHSVSHKPDIEGYWRNMSAEMWTNEIQDIRTMLKLYGKIPEKDVQGFRVPFLEVGGNLMYETLAELGFKYDCSWPTLQYTPWYSTTGEPLGAMWPYTLDYESIQEQTVGTKPTESFPGMWVNPMTDMQDNRGIECPMLDLCQSEEDELETSAAAVKNLLQRNFKSHYYSKRTPFGLYVHHSWFMYDILNNSTARHDGFQGFLDYLSGFPDVYVATVSQVLEWVQDPQTVEEMAEFPPFQCADQPPTTCPVDNQANCHYQDNLPIEQTEVYMKICEKPCPKYYPWTGNPQGIET